MKQPKFNLRDKVKYTLSALVTGGIKIEQEKEFYITSVNLTSDANSQTFTYSIATSVPDAYYGGDGFINNVPEGQLS